MKAAIVNAVRGLHDLELAEVAVTILAIESTHFKNLKPLPLVAHKLHRINVLHTKGKMREALRVRHTGAWTVF